MTSHERVPLGEIRELLFADADVAGVRRMFKRKIFAKFSTAFINIFAKYYTVGARKVNEFEYTCCSLYFFFKICTVQSILIYDENFTRLDLANIFCPDNVHRTSL